VLVDFNYVFDSIHFRVKNVAVQSEAVVGLARDGRDSGSKTKNGNLLVVIVVLQNASDSFYCI